jgi:predicted nuclease of predicted toxin-antitoxin system
VTQGSGAFVVDLNVGEAVAEALKLAGHDVVFISDGDPTMRDRDILRLAVHDQRIVITMDHDFGELVYRSGEPHAGILLLRMPDSTASEKVRVVGEIISRFGGQLPRHFSVYRNGRLRVRP